MPQKLSRKGNGGRRKAVRAEKAGVARMALLHGVPRSFISPLIGCYLLYPADRAWEDLLSLRDLLSFSPVKSFKTAINLPSRHHDPKYDVIQYICKRKERWMISKELPQFIDIGNSAVRSLASRIGPFSRLCMIRDAAVEKLRGN